MASNECNPYLPGVDVVEPCPSPSADVEAVASDVASAADAKKGISWHVGSRGARWLSFLKAFNALLCTEGFVPY